MNTKVKKKRRKWEGIGRGDHAALSLCRLKAAVSRARLMTNLECADALRRLADIIAANPKMSNPFSRGANTLCISCFDAEEFAATVRAFRRGTKEDNLANESIDFTPDFPIPVRVFGHKRWMCQMRPVTRVVPRQVIPAEPAREERIIDEHPETVMEYDCHPILAGLLSNGEPEMATVADVAEALGATQ